MSRLSLLEKKQNKEFSLWEKGSLKGLFFLRTVLITETSLCEMACHCEESLYLPDLCRGINGHT